MAHHSSDLKKAIERLKLNDDQAIEWLDKETSGHHKDDFIRLNFTGVIDAILQMISKPCQEASLNKLVQIVLKFLNFTITHPSLQRTLQLDQISVFIDCLGRDPPPNLKTQSLLLKCIKYAIKIHTPSSLQRDGSGCDAIVNKLVVNLKTVVKEPSESQVVWTNLLLDSIRCVYLLLDKFKLSDVSDSLLCGQILSVIKACCFLGLPGFDIQKTSLDFIYPSHFSNLISFDDSGDANKGAAKKNKKKKRNSKKPVNQSNVDEDDVLVNPLIFGQQNSGSGTSDSEFSSTDFEALGLDEVNIVKNLKNKIRLASYDCLSMVVKLFDKKTIFKFWSSLIPDSSSSLLPNFNILTSILKDPSPKVRLSALNFLSELLASGEQFVLTLTDNRQQTKQMSFIPISMTLASMVSEIHRCLCLVLFAEPNTQVLLQTFKCLLVLVNCTPYNKMSPGLLTSLCHQNMFLLNKNDIQLQNLCLVLINAVFNLDPFPEEMNLWLDEKTGNGQKLIQFCTKHVLNRNSIILSGESLKVLSTFLRSDIKSNTSNFVSFKEMMQLGIECANDDIVLKNQVIQNLTCKFVQSIGNAFKCTKEKIEKDEIKLWWKSIQNTLLMKNAFEQLDNNHIQKSSQVIIIDFMSNIPEFVFEDLKASEKYYLITLLFGFATDDLIKSEVNVRASAVRCIGVYQSFSSLSEDLSFLSDVCNLALDILREMISSSEIKDSLIYQTSWTLGNTTDILKKHQDNDEINAEFLNEIIKVVLQAFDLNISGIQGDNIKTNFVRTFGNIIQLIIFRKTNNLDDDIKSNICSAIIKLIFCLRNCRSFKLHWNTCYALTSLLSFDLFIDICAEHVCKEQTLIDELISAVYDLMLATRNHKVQSYAAEALCAPTKFHHFGKRNPIELWCQLAKFMVDNYLSVPNELKSNWICRYCNGLNKLLLLLKENDSLKLAAYNLTDLKEIFEEFSQNESVSTLSNNFLNL